MAARLLLLLLVSACAAELGFKPKRQYTYLYEAKQASGIPGLQSQWSVFGMKTKVAIQDPAGDGNLYFKLEDLQQGELKNVHTHQPWRKNLSMPYMPVQPYQEALSRVFKVQLVDGVISKFISSGDDPIWVDNIKKSIAQMFQLDLRKQQAIDVPSMAQPTSYQSEREAESFRVMEDSIGGECETLYEMTPRLPLNINADIVQELTILSQSSLPGIKVPSLDQFQPFIVTKTKNYQNCRSRPNWQHITPGAISCRSEDCYLTASNRSASARYVLDGDRSSFKIQYLVAESAALMFPYRHETEQLWTVTNQTLFLQQDEPTKSFFGEPQRAKTHETLAFQYPTADRQELRLPDLKAAPQLSTYIPGAPAELIHKQQDPSQLVVIVASTISKLDQLTHLVPDPLQQDVAGYVIEIERALSWLSYDQLSQVYKKLTSQQQKNIYWDTLALTGTNPAVMQIIDGMHSGKIEETRLATILATLPISIKTPTHQLLRKLFDVYQSKTSQSQKQSHMNMALSLGNIFYQVCTSNTTVEHSYTQSLYQQRFCNYEAKQLIQEQFIPQLVKEIQIFEQKEQESGTDEPKKLAYIQALGNTGDQRIISALSKLITKQQRPQVASKAIYAFYRVVAQYPETVRKIVSPIFHDVSRPVEVRLAAVTMLLATNPPIEYWQKVATSTWFEPSNAVVAFIHSTYSTIANITMAQVQPLFEMSRRARTTLPMIRPPQGGFALSGSYNYRSAQLIPQYQAATLDYFSIIASKTSVIPSSMYMECQEYINSILNSNYRWSLTVQGGQKIIDDIMGVGNAQSFRRQSPRDLGARFQQLGGMLQSIKPEKFQAAVYTQLEGAIDTFIALDESSLQMIREGGKLSKQHIHKIAYLQDSTVAFASEIGMPIIYSKKMPVVASARGTMSAEWSWVNGQYHISIKKVQPFVSIKNLISVGTISPFSLRALGAGVENAVQVSLPVSLEAKLDIQTKKLQVEMETVKEPSAVQIVHMQTFPFTTAVKVTSYENFVRSADTKEITTGQKTVIQLPFGKTIGVDGYLRLISDNSIMNFGTFWTELQKRGTAGISNFWFMMGSLRSRHYDIVIDTSRSNFQKLEATFSYQMTSPSVLGQQRVDQVSSATRNPRRPMQEHQWMTPKATQQQTFRMSSKKALVASAIITQKNGGAMHYMSELEMRHDPQWYTQQLSFLAKSPSKRVNLDMTLQFPEMSDDRMELLRSDIKASVSARISDDTSQQPILKMQGFARRDEVAKKYAASCPEALRCAQHERDGNPNSADCRLAKNHAALANHYELIFSDNGLPQSLWEASYGLKKFADYMFWPFMRSTPFLHNPQNQVNVTIQLDPYKNGMNLNISTPSENTTFANVPLPFNMLYEPGLLTMRKSVHKKVVDSLYGVDKTVCIVDKRVVKTFDNVTLERQPSDCWTLLVKDSSSIRQLAVYEKVVSQQSVARIQVADVQIEIDSANLGRVKVNGRTQGLSYDTPVVARDSAGKILAQVVMLTHRQDIVKVVLPEHYAKLLVTKEGVQIRASLMAYRGRLRGVCGDFNGEEQDDLLGPDDCIYKKGQKFYEAYWSQKDNQPKCKPSGPPECIPQQALTSQSQGYHQYAQRS